VDTVGGSPPPLVKVAKTAALRSQELPEERPQPLPSSELGLGRLRSLVKTLADVNTSLMSYLVKLRGGSRNAL
jgi:hypothetical protein